MANRDRSLILGANLTDVALGETHNVDAGTFNYYGYTRPDNSFIILREKTDETEYRYNMNETGNEVYSDEFGNRADRDYVTPDKFSDIF